MEQPKKLYRSKKERIIAGVCGGLGEYFNIDPVIFRILFVLLTLSGGAGVLIYLILIIVIPYCENGSAPSANSTENHEKSVNQENSAMRHDWLAGRRNLVAIILILVGILALGSQIFPMQWFSWSILWPILVILFGFYLIFRKH